MTRLRSKRKSLSEAAATQAYGIKGYTAEQLQWDGAVELWRYTCLACYCTYELEVSFGTWLGPARVVHRRADLGQDIMFLVCSSTKEVKSTLVIVFEKEAVSAVDFDLSTMLSLVLSMFHVQSPLSLIFCISLLVLWQVSLLRAHRQRKMTCYRCETRARCLVLGHNEECYLPSITYMLDTIDQLKSMCMLRKSSDSKDWLSRV